MFRQYRAVKDDHPDAILLFRMGDFYEMFYEDAKTASRALELTLTARGKGTDNEAPMCGFPHHQLEPYLSRLVRAGHRVAVCEQTEDPKKAKGLVRRDVVRVVTPGTVLDPEHTDARENLWAAAVTVRPDAAGAAFLDATTGQFLAWQGAPGQDPWEALGERLDEFAPREIVHPENLSWSDAFRLRHAAGAVLTPFDDYAFGAEPAGDLLRRHLDVASLDGFGLRERPAAVGAAGALLLYVQENQKSGLEHVDAIAYHEPSGYLVLDPSTRRNLEVDRSLRDGTRRGTLIDAVDRTRTAGGGRLLRSWLLAPLLEVDEIRARHDAVDELVRRGDVRESLRERLDRVHDVERLVGRTVAGTAGPRDLLALRASLRQLPELTESLSALEAELTRRVLDGLDPCADVEQLLTRGLNDDAPATLRDGGVIRSGFDAELDELRAIRTDGRAYIAALESKEREATGIASLKVRFNKVFGYFIEVSRPNLHLVPEHYHRKQTIANGERFVTPELKEHESKVLHAQERIESLEAELFARLRAAAAAEASRLKAAASAVAVLDVVAGFAETACALGYCRPEIEDGPGLTIRDGRHPVVEHALTDRRFVPNDTEMTAGRDAVVILTGPNMGGKSTYLRQVALIVLLAQAGSFVPAEAASVGIVDRVFCRVGASDSLSEGQSTFMVEMTETANILNHATARSLVLLDEIGRGTSTFDGLSIAWAVVESLHAARGGAPRTLFATHYHELTELAVERFGVRNARMAVREHGDGVLFTHRVEPGAADRSYGIHVARLAGVPRSVVRRAEQILRNLERDAYGRDGLPRLSRGTGGPGPASRQATLFDSAPPAEPAPEPEDTAGAEVLASLRSVDLDRLTPVDALKLLDDWRRRLREDEPGLERS